MPLFVFFFLTQTHHYLISVSHPLEVSDVQTHHIIGKHRTLASQPPLLVCSKKQRDKEEAEEETSRKRPVNLSCVCVCVCALSKKEEAKP